jgi:hypothetical protein
MLAKKFARARAYVTLWNRAWMANMQNMGISVLFNQLEFGFPMLEFLGIRNLGPWSLGGIVDLGSLKIF